MKELTIENLHKTYGTKTLLDGIDLSIRTGDRIGLIGPNGTGKSSLLRVLAGLDDYDKGDISHPKQYEIGYLDQNPQLDPDQRIMETVYDSQAPQVQLVKRYQEAVSHLEADPLNESYQDAFNRMTEEMNRQDGWDMEVQAKTILSQLHLRDLNRKVGECSGGEQKRIGLAQVLMSQPDLLILDEPTNHLDVQSIQWLETYLANYQGALLLVTHDRYFLDRAVNRIIELRHGQLTSYEGNYESYLTKRSELAEIQAKMQDKQDKLYKQELAWMRTGAKARTTKQQARIDRFEALSDDIASRHGSDDALDFAFDQQRIGKRIMDLENVTVAIGDQLIVENFTKSFTKGERLGIIGANGVGKSTFLNALAGERPIQSGTYTIGQTVRMAYYRQLDEDLPGETRLLAYLSEIADEFRQEDGSSVSAAQMLERFNFPRISHGTQIKYLSGGERRRLYLLRLLIQEPNVLFLDEPTNDLDIDTLTVLEDYLADFAGVVIIVSHDRYFLDKTVDQLLDIQGKGQFTLSYGNYSDYLARGGGQTVASTSEVAAEKDQEPRKATPAPAKDSRQRMTYQEKKEWATLEADMEATEARIAEYEGQMLEASHDAGRLMELQEALDEANNELLHYYERYDYLSELKP